MKQRIWMNGVVVATVLSFGNLLSAQNVNAQSERQSAMDVTLLGVLQISEGGVHVPVRRQHYSARAAATDAATPVQPGELRVQASVNVQYEVGARPRASRTNG